MDTFKVLVQNVGIDIAKNSFVVCLSFFIDREAVVQRIREFKNTSNGFIAFLKWVNEH
ncbi:hypothetical protein [Microscilla marina]|uniref:hypothetical protein n=1 Tax=Microscilla marina TaxID=1027 RepID=UPI0012FCFAD6|nr:hypothetical protein [Microscilla marina]